MKKIGVFLKRQLVIEFPHTYEGGLEALNEAKECTSETGEFHEVKIYEDKPRYTPHQLCPLNWEEN
jgi:hypothetical protein